MRVLFFGATGNLGSRLLPALLAHGHEVVAINRSADRLQSHTTTQLYSALAGVYEGDAVDTSAVEVALRAHSCDAIVNAAGTSKPTWLLGKIAESVSSAAVRVRKDQTAGGRKALRAWFIGGLGSLEYPGTGRYNIQDYMPLFMTQHHRNTAAVLQAVSPSELEWTLLCVAFMRPDSERVERLKVPKGSDLTISEGAPPGWLDHWVRNIPIIGAYLNLGPVIASYTMKLEDVADLIAEQLAVEQAQWVGEMVGIKQAAGDKKS